MAISQPVICPVFIGRAPQVAAFNKLVAEVGAGDAVPPFRVALIAGEAGIGKSRFVKEVAAAGQNGLTILQGRCFEQDQSLPYAPMVDLLTAFCLSQPREHITDTLKPVAPELIRIFPELSIHLSYIAPLPLLEPEHEKRRIFQALIQFLNRAADASPLLLVIEDLHWCDDTSLEFFLTLIRRASTQPVLLVLTYRSDEIHPALHRFLAELDRAHLATEIHLDRLFVTDVEEMIRVIFEQQSPVHPEFSQAIHQLTDGNPFFVEETLKALITAGDIYQTQSGWTRKPISDLRIPRTVQDAVQRRVQQLSEPARQLLALASVAGRRFGFSLVQAMTGTSESELLSLIRELISAQLVVEESTEQFAFRHALTRQAVYASLLGREKQNLHRAFANALEIRLEKTSTGGALSGELSLHFFEGGEWQKAFDHAREAADHARALYTPRAAVEHLTRAIVASHYFSTSLPLDLYRTRGEQYETLGDFDAAEQDFQTVLDEARARNEKKTEWQALIDLGFLWAARDYNRTGEYFQQALDIGRQLDDSAALGHILNRVGNWHLNMDQAPEALRYHQEALRIFNAFQDRRGLASTHDLLGITYYSGNDVHQSIGHYEQAIALFRELDDRGGLASSLTISASRGNEYIGGTAIPMRTSLAERLKTLHEALTLARETDAKPAETMITLWRGMLLNSAGRYEGFDDLANGLAMAEAIEHQHFRAVAHMILGMSYVDTLSPEQARHHLERALELAQTTNSLIWIALITAHLALAHLQLNDFTRADSTLKTMLRSDMPMSSTGRCYLWVAKTELLLAQGQAGAALEIVERLIAASPNAGVEGEYSNPRLNRLRGDILIALRRYASAEKALRGALASARTLELPPQEWRLYSSLSRLLRAQGEPELAEEASAAASQIVETLSQTIANEAVREEFRGRADVQWRGSGKMSKKEAEKRQFGGLTPRERQVAGLIAAGKSNNEIAETLTLSHRTVEAHIGNILKKLGFNSRAQIAVWAVEKGLATP
jgi:tetratricopeptide (TPR) repeat protein